MAVSIRDMPITREQVHGWLEEFEGQTRATNKMRDFLAVKVAELELPDEYVYTPGATSRSDVTHVVELILGDIESYGGN